MPVPTERDAPARSAPSVTSFSASRLDATEALERLERGDKLTNAQFAAYVWSELKIPTAGVCVSSRGGWRMSVDPDGQPNYLTPARLCDHRSIYYQDSRGAVVDWARRYLADMEMIASCVNAGAGYTCKDGPIIALTAFRDAWWEMHPGEKAPDPWAALIADMERADPFADDPEPA